MIKKLLQNFNHKLLPQVCCVCDRAAFLRCLECSYMYCSSACQIKVNKLTLHKRILTSNKSLKDWTAHRKTHENYQQESDTLKELSALDIMKDRFNVVKGERSNVQNRLKKTQDNAEMITETISSMPMKNINNSQQELTKIKKSNVRNNIQSDENSNVIKLIKDQSGAKSYLSSAMKELAGTIKEITADNIVDDLSEIFQNVSISEDPLAKSSDDINLNQNLDIFKHKYDCTSPIPPNFKDLKGFFMATVTFIEAGSIFSVVHESESADFLYFKQMLNYSYNDDANIPCDIINQNEYDKYINSLLMVKIRDQWTRCRIQCDQQGKFTLMDIDSGKKYNMLESLNVKRPKDPEKLKSALSFKLKIVNPFNESSVQVGNRIKIRLIKANFEDISEAEIVIETPKEAKNDIIYMINHVKAKIIPSGNQTLTFVDGSRLSEEGKIHVHIKSEEFTSFYNQLFTDTQTFIATNPDKNNHHPIVGELVLAIFSDGNAYRAVVSAVNTLDCKVIFIDYGSIYHVSFNDIWKLPEKFTMDSFSTTVNVELKSGKNFKDAVDVDRTLEKLEAMQYFDGYVVHLDSPKGYRKYTVIIDDNIIALKN